MYLYILIAVVTGMCACGTASLYFKHQTQTYGNRPRMLFLMPLFGTVLFYPTIRGFYLLDNLPPLFLFLFTAILVYAAGVLDMHSGYFPLWIAVFIPLLSLTFCIIMRCTKRLTPVPFTLLLVLVFLLPFVLFLSGMSLGDAALMCGLCMTLYCLYGEQFLLPVLFFYALSSLLPFAFIWRFLKKDKRKERFPYTIYLFTGFALSGWLVLFYDAL